MSSNQRIWSYVKQHRAVSIIGGHLVVVLALVAVIFGTSLGSDVFSTFAAQGWCSQGDRTYVVSGGDSLGTIAARFGTTWQKLASYNKISNPNLIYIAQHICIPGAGQVASGGGGGNKPPVNNGPQPIKGNGNYFPYGQCTWYAAQRYFQMHSIYVPWTTNANAGQWADRAREFHWNVSGSPTVGSIVMLSPWVQGASGYGHVAVAERILGNGHVIASNMNWGPYYSQVTNVEFVPGPGVAFITF